MGQFYFAETEECTMIFAKSMYPKRRDCVNTAHNLGYHSLSAQDVKPAHAVVTYDDNDPIAVTISKKGIDTIPVWVIY